MGRVVLDPLRSAHLLHDLGDALARGTKKTEAAPPAAAASAPTGPPLLILVLGFASVLASLPLLSAEGIPIHVLGYVTGALIPILVVGLVRRIDLERRRNPRYLPRSFVRPALAVLAVAALVAAGLHVWPIATELAR